MPRKISSSYRHTPIENAARVKHDSRLRRRKFATFRPRRFLLIIRIMAEFSYKARRRSGELVEGVLEVADRPAALVQIQRLGLFPIAVETAKPGAAASIKRNGQKADLLSFLPPTLRAQLSQKRKPKLQELATFTNQLANLLQSGMPLTVALNSMTHLESKGIPAEVSRGLKQEVTEGRGLSEAMAKQPQIFSDLYIK